MQKKLNKVVAPRINKNKEELVADIERKQRIEQDKKLVTLMFPLVAGMKTIYDAQTALSALSGFITYGIEEKMLGIKLNEISIDLSKEKTSEVKTAVLHLQKLLINEDAKHIASLLKRFGDTLAQYSAKEYMKNPMKKLKVTDIVS